MSLGRYDWPSKSSVQGRTSPPVSGLRSSARSRNRPLARYRRRRLPALSDIAPVRCTDSWRIGYESATPRFLLSRLAGEDCVHRVTDDAAHVWFPEGSQAGRIEERSDAAPAVREVKVASDSSLTDFVGPDEMHRTARQRAAKDEQYPISKSPFEDPLRPGLA